MNNIISILILTLLFSPAMADSQYETFKDEIELARKIIAKQRNDLVLKNMGLTVHEEKYFFGVYNGYRDEIQPILDRQAKLITDYADAYVNNTISDKQAIDFAEQLLDIKARKIELRKRYIGIFSKKISARHVARFIQLENKLDAVMNYDIARQVPLIPVD